MRPDMLFNFRLCINLCLLHVISNPTGPNRKTQSTFLPSFSHWDEPKHADHHTVGYLPSFLTRLQDRSILYV